MTNTRQIRDILDEIDSKEAELFAGSTAWKEGTDECAMASCDPSDQYQLSNEIQELWQQISVLVKENT